MTGTDSCVNKPHCAAAVRPSESEATTCSVLSGSYYSDERTEGTAERGTTHCDQIARWRKRPVRCQRCGTGCRPNLQGSVCQ